MSMNFQKEFSLVGGGVWFVPSAALGRRTERSGFISGPDLCVLWICAGIWEVVALQRVTRSFLQKPLTFGCFGLVQRRVSASLSVSVPLIHSQKPSGLCRVCEHPAECLGPRPLSSLMCVHLGVLMKWRLCNFSKLPGDAGTAASQPPL